MCLARVAPARYSSRVGIVDGVLTTGIYCRPECGARPLPEHVVEFPLAAAAEAAGMRACLRCRPYRTAQSLSWTTSQELICRAVRMITSGALNDGTEAGLAARLGVSGRHLRRTFVAQLGVTPDGLARSVRVHFARSLLDDTDIPVTHIAYLAGFGSVRQFNRDCVRVFRDTPSRLRARRGSATRLSADGGLGLRLWFTGPLDWPALTAFLAGRAVAGVEHLDGHMYRRTIAVDGDPGVLELGPGGPRHLVLRLHLPHWSGLLHLVARARRIAGLDEDTEEPARLLAADPVIGPLVVARPGVRVPGAWDPFEAGVAAIIGQRPGPTAARAALSGVIGAFGRPVPGLGPMRLTHTFPAPGDLAGQEAGLAAAGLDAERARAVSLFATAVSDGAVPLDRSAGTARLTAAMTAIPGVTASTAEYVALRAGEPDAFPADDPVLRGMLARLPRMDRAGGCPPAGWRPWRAHAVAALWAARASDAAGQSISSEPLPRTR